ncbi:MAG TPA: hypothetical protein VFV70_07820, partial [Hyphomonadaceae bacterium]|nr:hypothetical protein [Hyphomonadaceae bacterium]
MTETTSYNNRQQMISMSATRAGTALLALGLFYCPGQASSCATNNGNLISQSISHAQIGTSGQPEYEAALNLTQNYGSGALDGYDALNRLVKFSEGGASRDFAYDRYGNVWVSSNTGLPLNGLTPQAQSWFNAADNRLTAVGYDA